MVKVNLAATLVSNHILYDYNSPSRMASCLGDASKLVVDQLTAVVMVLARWCWR